MIAEENWHTIQGYEGLYEVSSLGRVRAIFPHQHLKPGRLRKLIKTCTNRGPTAVRYRVHLYKVGTKKEHYVHVLACTAFHGPRPSPLHQAAHGDGDGLNNREDNLRWTLPEGNYDDMKRHGIHRAAMRAVYGKLSDDQIKLIRQRRSDGERLEPLASEFSITVSHACAIAKGRRGGPL